MDAIPRAHNIIANRLAPPGDFRNWKGGGAEQGVSSLRTGSSLGVGGVLADRGSGAALFVQREASVSRMNYSDCSVQERLNQPKLSGDGAIQR
jgi:hypothetical protein